MRFTKYSELIACMLLAEKHQLFLLDNSKKRPPGTTPPPQQSETHFNVQNDRRFTRGGHGNFRGRGFSPDGRGCWQGRGGRSTWRHTPASSTRNGWRSTRPEGSSGRGRGCGRGNMNGNRAKLPISPKCFRCGSLGHIRKDCRAPAHLVQLYQANLPNQP